MQRFEAKVAFPTPVELGEGSLWDGAQERLYWIDIAGNKVFAFNPKNGSNLAYDVGENVGTVVVARNDKLLLALRSGIACLDPATGKVKKLVDPRPAGEETRFNDGKCDPRGRLWAGTMFEGKGETTGALYRFETDLSASKVIGGVRTSNGLVWKSDATRFYYIDTPTHQVWAYDFDVEAGTITNRSIVVEFPKGQGGPDGMAIDTDDHLWIALFGGSKVVRIDPATGAFECEVAVPARNVTSCAFGGAELDELYITTARVGLSAEQLQQQPLAGSLFRAKVPFRGVPAQRFAADL